MELVLSLLSGSGLLGGLFGFVQTWLETKKAAAQHKQLMELNAQEHKQRMEEIAAEAEQGYQQLELETQAQLALARESNRAIAEESAQQSLRSSFAHDAALQIGTSQWVRDGRAATRFLLTWLTVAIALGVGVYLAATSDDARPYFMTIASFATTAFGWWFARRSKNSLDALDAWGRR